MIINIKAKAMSRRSILSLCLLWCLALVASAQIRGNNIVVTVEPDHQDWNYRVGETAKFTVEVRRSGTLVDNVDAYYEAGPVMYPNEKKSVRLVKGKMTHKGSMKTPGFYRLKVTATVDGKDYEAWCTAAFSPERLMPYAKDAADFDAFWQRALDEARQQGLHATRRFLPERSDETSNVYEVSYVNNRQGSRVYGILSVPVKPGKYPALLRVPGAGVRPYSGDTYTAPGKCIVLEIGIHGIPVTMDQSYYDLLANGALNGYWNTNLDNPDLNYYKRVVTGAVKAVDYIASLPEWNGTSLGVTGSSQGGFLSLAVAALDKRVTFLAAVHDAMCDYEAELHGVAGGWPHYFYGHENDNSALLKARVAGARYYDGVNFARRVTQPGWYSFGYNDDVVPPTSSYSLYNSVKAPKRLSVYQQTAHFWYQEQWDEWQEYLREQMNID